MRKRAKQKTDEKIAIAEQTLELVESFVRKIDTVTFLSHPTQDTQGRVSDNEDLLLGFNNL